MLLNISLKQRGSPRIFASMALRDVLFASLRFPLGTGRIPHSLRLNGVPRSARPALAVVAACALLDFALHSDLVDLVLLSRLRFRCAALARRYPRLASFLPLPKWISNIPGNATAADDATIALVGPFPELNDHNAIVASLPLPATVRGVPPECCYWSIQCFFDKAKGDDGVSAESIVCDREFDLDGDGKFTLVISGAKPTSGARWIDSGAATRVKLLVMRAFRVRPGRAWAAPKLLDCSGAAWPARAETRVGGPCAAARGGPAARLAAVVRANCALSLVATAPELAIAAGAAAALRGALLGRVAARTRRRLYGERSMVPNETVALPAARASLGGSSRHASRGGAPGGFLPDARARAGTSRCSTTRRAATSRSRAASPGSTAAARPSSATRP